MKYKTMTKWTYGSGLFQLAGGGFAIAALSSENLTHASIGFGGYVFGGLLYRAFNNASRGTLKDEINDLEKKVEELKK